MDDRGYWNALQAEPEVTAKAPVIVLTIGEVVEIKGENFRVRKITRKDIVLRSVRQGVDK